VSDPGTSANQHITVITAPFTYVPSPPP